MLEMQLKSRKSLTGIEANSNKNKKLIMFDLDGTIIDSLKDMKNSMNYMLKEIGGEEISISDMKEGMTKGRRYLIEKSLKRRITDIENKQYQQIYNNYYKDNKNIFTKPYDGILKLLNKLKEQGFLLAVCSNKIHRDTEQLVSEIFPNTFDFILGSSSKHKRKPSVEMLEYIIQQLNVLKEETIFVGDTMSDMEAALSLDIFKIYTAYGFGDKNIKDLTNNKIDKIVYSPNEIYNIILDYFKYK